MNVWVVEWFSAEQYTDYSGVDSVHATEEAALTYIQEQGEQPIRADPDNYDDGLFLREPTMFEVNK